MKRRDVLTITGAGVAAHMLIQGASAQAQAPAGAPEPKKLAAPCGLYCGVCNSYVGNGGACHGICGCPCGQCPGAKYAQNCGIAKCAFGRKLESCADCPELPCTKLIQMVSDPVWRTGSVAIENLRRRKKIGTDAWLAEQAQYWSNKNNLNLWLAYGRECEERSRTFGK